MRQLVDLSHNVLTCGKIGRLQGVARLPVIAGDSIEWDGEVTIRLNQLKRPMAIDCKVELFAFYNPYRFTYGQSWVDYIESGTEETVTFPTVGGSYNAFWLLNSVGNYPLHQWADGARIYNRYFRDPYQAEMSLTVADHSEALRRFGPICSHLHSWGTSQSRLADMEDAEFDVDTSKPAVSVFDIQSALSKGRAKNFRDFVSSRYPEVMAAMGGKGSDDYALQQPELLWRESRWMSGYDINATAGSDLGRVVGKGIVTIPLRFPRRFFPEHGTINIFALVRMPPMFIGQKQYLDNFNRPFQHVVPMAADAQPPVELTMGDVFDSSSSASLGYVPAHDWYRCHPGFVHQQFWERDKNWQYLPTPSNPANAIYVGQYDNMFQSSDVLGHFVCIAQHRPRGYRPLPGRDASIFGDFK